MAVAESAGFLKHILLNVIKQGGDRSSELLDLDLSLLGEGVTTGDGHDAVLDIARPDLDADGYALHLPLVELPTGALIAVIHLDADACVFKRRLDLLRFFVYAAFVRRDGDDDPFCACLGVATQMIISQNHRKYSSCELML